MPYDVKLPDIGEGVAEGEIVRWLVKAGDSVREDQPLVEVMTDKASVEIPAPRTGVIAALHCEEGQVVPVGTVIVSIDVAGESASAAPAAAHAVAHGATAAPAAASAVGTAAPPAPAARVQATPAVRQLAKQMGVALEGLAGSGPGGTITADDVKRAAGGGTPATGTPAKAAPAGPETRIPLRGLRRLIAEQMRRSIDRAAHFTFVAECDMTEVVAHRERLKPRAQAAGVKLTYLPYVIQALIASLKKFPTLNAILDDDAHEIVLKGYFHIGVATHTEDGLTVPVLRNADRLGLFAIARELERLSTAARARKLDLEELQGGTFTVTSTGAQGGVLATPILHYPQVAILGMHEVKKRPAVVNDQIVARDLGNFSLSLDHRVVDGAVGAQFLYDLIARLEKPGEWAGEGDLS